MAGLELSVVIPVYEQAQLLSHRLPAVFEHLEARGGAWEVIVVSDGCGDGVEEVLAPLLREEARCRLLRLGRNRGKGAAIRQGVLEARGEAVRALGVGALGVGGGGVGGSPGDPEPVRVALVGSRDATARGLRTARRLGAELARAGVTVVSDGRGTDDCNGHGTHCAGIAGAATNNGLGIASYNWEGRFVTVRGYKALSDNSGGSAESVSEAIIAAARDRADVISLSLGGYAPTPPRAEVLAVEFAIKKGCIVVCAAGNSNEDAKLHAPANIPGVIVVSALDQGMRKASFSNTNTSLGLPIAAPGVDIFSLKPGTGYVGMSGTSMATPAVAGVLACVLEHQSENPDAKFIAESLIKDAAQNQGQSFNEAN